MGLYTLALVALIGGKPGLKVHRKLVKMANFAISNAPVLKREQYERLTAIGITEDLEAAAIAATKADSAREAAISAREKALYVTQKTRSERREQVTEHKTKTKVNVLKEKTKADISVEENKEARKISTVKARQQQEVKREKEKNKHAMNQQYSIHEAKTATNLQKHHVLMTDLNAQRSAATQKATASIKKNTEAANKVAQAVLKLKLASSAAHDSRLKLIKAMNEYELALVNHKGTEDEEKALQMAYLANLQIEKKLETQLAVNQVNEESEALQDIMVELAIGETTLNEALENCSPVTRAKLLKIHESEILTVEASKQGQEQAIDETSQVSTELNQRLAALKQDVPIITSLEKRLAKLRENQSPEPNVQSRQLSKPM